MKQLCLLLAAALFSTAAQAKIWRVNNNPGVTADFTTVQAAHNGAAAGDTIHLEPSIYTYGDLTMTKKLYMVSTGQFVSDNPGYQQDARMGFVDGVTINNTGANGTVLSVRCNGRFFISGVSNISLINCANTYAQSCSNSIYGVYMSGTCSNIIISGSWLGSISIQPLSTCSNIIISNNLIGGSIETGSASSGITISNNVINAVIACNNEMQNSQVINNIFNKGAGLTNVSSSVFKNNFSSDNTLPTGTGNVNNVNMSNVFINAAGNSVDNQYQLKAGSPAIGAGLSGEDLGAFGGSSPFRLAVTPAIPSIYKLVVPTTPVSNTMNITFSTRSN